MVLLSVISVSSFAGGGKLKIKGTVKDAAGNPVEKAVILADGMPTGVMTNVKGQYSVKVNKDAQSLGVIAPGNVVDADLINGRSKIDFKLSLEVTGNVITPVFPGDEQVNTGYSTLERKYMTTQIDRVDGNARNYSTYSSVGEMIEREVSGVRYSNGSYIIHNTMNMDGPVPALLVVDGTYVNTFAGIAPSTVGSIEVLKGTAAAIYGSRGYGGAIVVTTKK